jgi:hypothetical protein
MVQTAALTAQTNVKEDRRTNRAIGRTTIVLPSNQAVLIERNETLIKEGKPSFDRVQGRHQLASQLNFICQFLKDSKRAKKRFSDVEYHVFCVQSKSNRASNMESSANALIRPRKRNKAEKPTGIDTPAAMGGGILLHILTKKNGLEGVVNAEITAQEIPMSKKQQDTAEPKTPGVPWCFEFFVPNIKHKGTPRI